MKKALGIVELENIVQGILAADTMAKASNIELVEANSVCPGKYLVIISGDVGAVKSAVKSAEAVCVGTVIDKHVIPNVHEDVFPAITGTTYVKEIKALGIIETFSAVSAIIAGDTAVKAANVNLLEIRLARGMGGKAVVTLTGDVGAVKSAVDSGSKTALENGLLLDKLVIPAPHKELKINLL